MLNTKFKKSCLVKSKVNIKGLTKDRNYVIIDKVNNSIRVINDLGIMFYYNKRYFEEVKK